MRKITRVTTMTRRTAGATMSVALVIVALAAPGVASATPPIPVIAVQQPANLQIGLDASTGTSWSWTIVDALGATVTTSAVKSPLVTFAAAGNYTAKVDAYDADPLKPTPAHAEATFHVYAKPTANFTAAVIAPGTVQLTNASTGEPTAWTWTYPGGTYTGQTPPPIALPVGTSNVTLTVTNAAGSSAVTTPVTVNGPPVAALTATPNPAPLGSTVVLDARGSTDPNKDALAYAWDLNGDQIYADAAGSVQSQVYSVAGTYRVGVSVNDGHGGTSTAVAFVTVASNRPPQVSFTFTPARPMVGAPVTFRATASDPDGSIAALDWDLDGDGRFDDAAGPTGSWTFKTPGEKMVSVRATDDRGAATIAFQTLSVTGAAPVTGSAQAPSIQPPPGSAPVSSSPDSSPSPSTRLTLLAPSPVVHLRGLIFARWVQIDLLSVQAPRGATVRVLCHGSSCSKARVSRRVVSASKSLRFHAMEQRMRPGTTIEVFITAPGRIGRYTSFAIRPKVAPVRRDLCLIPGRAKPATCPKG